MDHRSRAPGWLVIAAVGVTAATRGILFAQSDFQAGPVTGGLSFALFGTSAEDEFFPVSTMPGAVEFMVATGVSVWLLALAAQVISRPALATRRSLPGVVPWVGTALYLPGVLEYLQSPRLRTAAIVALAGSVVGLCLYQYARLTLPVPVERVPNLPPRRGEWDHG